MAKKQKRQGLHLSSYAVDPERIERQANENGERGLVA